MHIRAESAKMRARDGCRTAGLVSVPDPSLAGPDLPGEEGLVTIASQRRYDSITRYAYEFIHKVFSRTFSPL